MKIGSTHFSFIFLIVGVFYVSCTSPLEMQHTNASQLPENYTTKVDSTNTANINWKEFFNDKYSISLIDTAIKKIGRAHV